MSKRILALILVLTLAIGMFTVASATNTDSDAGIEFTPITTPPGIFDPDPDPDDPNPLLPGIQGIDIDFWVREVSQTTRTYNSWYGITAGTIDAVAEMAAGFVTGDPPQHVPHQVPSSSGGLVNAPRQSAAGIGVRAISNWSVNASINGFNSTTGPNATNATMVGFSLQLTAHDNFNNAGTTLVTPTPIAPLLANTTGGFGVPTQVASGAVNSGQLGLAGVNYRGALTVLGGSAHVGEAQATLRWTFVAAP